MEHYGFISLIPAASVLLLALITKRTFEALIGGTLIGFLIVGKQDFFGKFADSALNVMSDPTIGWIILVCGLFGSLIAMLIKSGGALAFGNHVEKFVKGKKSALMTTWVLGLIIFIDDYLNALTVSSAMRRVTDKHRTSREMLAYVVDSTAAPVCVLLPFSTWAIFVAGLLETSGAASKGNGLTVYISAIPYMLYAWVAVIMVPLVAMRILPRFRSMKKAERRAEEEGIVVPPGSENAGLVGEDVAPAAKDSPKLYNFLLPIVVLIFATWYFGVDAFKGVLVAIALAIVLYLVQRIMSLTEIFDAFFEGFKSMIFPLAIVIASFMLKDVNDALGLTSYIIESVEPFMSVSMLPVVAFLSLSLVTFATGSFWGVYAVALPIVIPLAQSMGANLPLAIGAVISAGAFGSHACFYGDSTVLSAAGCGCSNIDHAVTQLPYALLGAAVASVLFVVAGVAF
ncbi:MAG: sodium:proton antiporter [Deltaproteobacteria bacterium]|nr:MAG: sodium:proton antiporter [Deltaproteobacteria bacterium]